MPVAGAPKPVPVPQVAPAVAPPAHSASQAQDAPAPRHHATEARYTAPAQDAGVPFVAGYTKVGNDLLGRMLPTLDVYDQVVMVRLWRLSRGFSSDTCRVAQPTLAKSCNISERQLRITLGRLEARGLVKRIERDFDNKNLAQRGTIFRVLVPDIPPAQRTTLAQYAALAFSASEVQGADIKEHTLKETHTNTESVRVGSRFSLKECRQYADSLKSEGIQNPGGYATKIHRTGEADELIERFLNPPAPAPQVDASQCPECQGSGWWYPAGKEKGIARCRHEQLHMRT